MLFNTSTAMLSNEFAATVSMVFDSMIGKRVDRKELLEGPPQEVPGNILAFITMSEPSSTAIVALHCDRPLLDEIYTAMFGEPPTSASDEGGFDAFGELANVIVGNFKNTLKIAGDGPLRMSVPTIIVGRKIPTDPSSEAKWFAVKFDVQSLPMFGSILITRNS